MDAIADLPVTPVAATVQQVVREEARTVTVAAATANGSTAKTRAAVGTTWIGDNHASVGAITRAASKKLGPNRFSIAIDCTFGHAPAAEAMRRKAVPTKTHAAVYTAWLHVLRSPPRDTGRCGPARRDRARAGR